MKVSIVNHINLTEAYTYLQSEAVGAIQVFVGTVRNHSQGKEVIKLTFEAYEKMAVKEMEKIGQEALSKWPLSKVWMEHAKGDKKPGEPVVVIGVSSAHRDAAFEACRYVIDQLKQRVPIWKNEFYTDKSMWVNAHP